MEEAISSVGVFGKFQKLVTAICISLGNIPFMLSIAYSYLTKLPPFLCKNENGEYVPCEYDEQKFCNGEIDFIKDRKNSIDNFAYDLDLYCKRDFFRSIYGSFFFFGALTSALIMAPIPDKYGRKTILQIFQIFSCFVCLSDLFIINPWQLALIYFLSGFSTYAYGMCSIIIAEYLPHNVSNIVMSICNGIFSITGIFLGFYFHAVNNKKVLFIIVFIVQVVMTYYTLKYFKESPIWLFSMKLKNKFIETLKEIAEINNNTKEFNDYMDKNKENLNYLLEDKNKNNEQKDEIPSISLYQIYSFDSQRSNMIRSFLVFFSVGLLFYGIILNLAYTKFNFFITCYSCFAGEITGELSSGILANKYGRIKVMTIFCFVGGICFLLFSLVKISILSYISIYFATLGIASTFNVIFIYTPELFPTPIRAKVFSYCFLISRIGAMTVGPITKLFGVFTTDMLFSAIAFFCGVVVTNMKETLGKPLENSIPEMDIYNLVDKAKEKMGKDAIISQHVLNTSFNGFDPVTFHHVRFVSSKKVINYDEERFHGIHSRK